MPINNQLRTKLQLLRFEIAAVSRITLNKTQLNVKVRIIIKDREGSIGFRVVII